MSAISSLPSQEPSPPHTSAATPPSPRKNHLEIYAANRARLFPNVTDAQWNDWKWQQKNRVTTLEQVKELFGIDEFTTERLAGIAELYRTAITPYSRCLIDFDNPRALPPAYLENIRAGLGASRQLEVTPRGSRVPLFLPQRIDAEMTSLLEKYHPIWVNTHFNHPNGITPESASACDRLLRAGIPVNNQAVLLRGVNDCAYTMRDLVQGLMRIRVRPYYLYLCDQVMGAEHFRTSVGEGIEIIEFLRGHTSGLAVPQFVMDAPGGGGKVPLMPNYVLGNYCDSIVYPNFQGVIARYDDVQRKPQVCDRS